jgi:hypothetical protein
MSRTGYLFFLRFDHVMKLKYFGLKSYYDRVVFFKVCFICHSYILADFRKIIFFVFGCFLQALIIESISYYLIWSLLNYSLNNCKNNRALLPASCIFIGSNNQTCKYSNDFFFQSDRVSTLI